MPELVKNLAFVDGDAYEQMHGHWSRAVGKEFMKWLSIAEGFRWLDVGCGTGAASAMILAEGHPDAVVGIDPSEQQVAFARAQVTDERADFRTGDAQSLEFADGEFDVAMSALVLNLVPDCSKMVTEMKRVVRSGGVVASYIWDLTKAGHPMCPLVEALARLDPNAPRLGGGGKPVESREDLLHLFEGARLNDVVTEPFEVTQHYGSFDDYWAETLLARDFGPLSAFIKSLSGEELNEVRQILSEIVPPSDTGKVVFTASACGIRGVVP